ncbi:Acidic mammalian chitinase [Daphnia magna]|uniref:Acidic mammalian chitinase n=1 Tax=Daphnia magna TaxID=35525 RepID=A0A162QUW5_9CRUS|nr:Acidic mammalian chitinase [Daphnia magna]
MTITLISKMLSIAIVLCVLFVIYGFMSKLSLTFLGFTSSTKLTSLSGPPVHQWNFENATLFLPGITNRLYRQEVYSRAARHHSRHLHGPKKYHVTRRQQQINHSFRRVCYYTVPSEEWPFLQPGQIDVSLCTHIIIGFAKISGGLLAPVGEKDEVIYKEVIELKKLAPELKILLSVGGASNDLGFHSVIETLEDREEFAVNSAKYLIKMGFDGIDVDWEFPAWYRPFEERFMFQMLLQELYYVYKNPLYNLTISVAVAASKSIIDRSYRVAQMAKYVDFVSLMGYDFHSFKWYLPLTGHNSPLYPRSDEWNMFSTVNLNWTSFYWVQLGMPREKIVIGLPTYGQTYQLYNPNFHGLYAPAIGAGTVGIGGQISYPVVCQFLANGGIREFDAESRVPFAYHKRSWISYDDEQSLEEKAKWIRSNYFGGVMVFDLNCDDYNNICGNNTFPLIKSILRGLTT